MTSAFAVTWALAAAPEPSAVAVPEPVPAEATEPAPETTTEAAAPAEAGEAPEESTASAPSPADDADRKPTLTGAVERSGPPFYSAADAAALDKRYGVAPPKTPPRKTRWRCLIADPTCGLTIEVVAMGAWAMRFRQGAVNQDRDASRWNSGRAQYDVWVDIPVLVETEGRDRYTRMTMGPKGGVIASDTGDLWGNLGVATRYWLGRGRWAPAIEFTSALSFKLGTRQTDNLGGDKPRFHMQRGPVGFTADVGVGLGGFGAIVFGGQYDSPFAREDVPDQFRTAAGGMVFVGFRGNILWGGPAAAAVLTHGVVQRTVNQP